MDNQLLTLDIPEEYEENEGGELVPSFSSALDFVKSSAKTTETLIIEVPKLLNLKEKQSLREIPEYVASNDTIKKLAVHHIKLDDSLAAEAMRAFIRKDSVVCLVLSNCLRAKNQRNIETFCKAFEERTAPLQLNLVRVSYELLKSLLETSYSKCFSLSIHQATFRGLEIASQRFFSRANLFYLGLTNLKLVKVRIFQNLARCVEFMPGLSRLVLDDIPLLAMKRLHGSLKSILGKGRLHICERVLISSPGLNDQLAFCFFRLLESDLISYLKLIIESNLSLAVVKSIAATVVNTKNLEHLSIRKLFCSRTNFKRFCLQMNTSYFRKPFQINPKVN